MSFALHFLLRFVIAASLGMGLWLWLGVEYVSFVSLVVNGITHWLGMPFQLLTEADRVLYAYQSTGRSFRLLATGQESIYLNWVALGAVFAATPGRSAGWRLGWGALALGLLWVTHVVSFYLGGYVALWQFAQSSEHAMQLAQPLASWIPANRGRWFLQVLETWNLWGRYGLCVLVWIVARARPEPSPVPVAAPSKSTWRVGRWILRPTVA